MCVLFPCVGTCIEITQEYPNVLPVACLKLSLFQQWLSQPGLMWPINWSIPRALPLLFRMCFLTSLWWIHDKLLAFQNEKWSWWSVTQVAGEEATCLYLFGNMLVLSIWRMWTQNCIIIASHECLGVSNRQKRQMSLQKFVQASNKGNII